MSRPDFSVVIPSYDRRPILQRALKAYERQEPAGFRFEVVVVDDGSTDGTAELLAELRPRAFTLRFARQENSGPARARNRALALARGSLILFAGDDVVPGRGFLRRHWEAHQRWPNRDVAIIGLTRWPPDLEITPTMRHVDGPGAQQFSFHYFEDGAEYDFRHFYTSNLSVKRELLDLEPTYFSTDFKRAAFEDVELSYRLSLHGMRIFYCAGAVAHHYHPYDVRGFFRRQVACGEMAAVLYDKFPVLERWLGVRALDAERAAALREPEQAWRRTAELAERLEEMEERLLRVISFYERAPSPPPLDQILAPLFRYAYQRGLGAACYEPKAACRLAARFFRASLVPATAGLVESVSKRGLPVPPADSRAILHHAA